MIFSRYLFVQLVFPYLMTVGILTFVMSMDTIYKLINLIVSKGVDVLEVGLLLLYRMPQFLAVTMPIAMVIAVFLVVIKFSMELEITAMNAAGLNYWQMAKPFAAFGLLAMALDLLITLWLQPAGFAAFEREQLRLLKTQTNKNIQPRVLNYDFQDKVLYIRDKDEKNGLWKQVFMTDRKYTEESSVIVSETGQILFDNDQQEMIVNLNQGTIHLDSQQENYRKLNFSELNYIFQMPSIIESKKKHVWGMSTYELLFVRKKHSSLVELMLRFTTPVACLSFALAALPLGITDPRSGRSGAYLRALILVVVYYVLWLGTKRLTFKEEWSPQILWFPAVAILLYGMYQIHRMNQGMENFHQVASSFFGGGSKSKA